MSNLLAIETEFLRNENVQSALDLRSIKKLQRSLSNGQKKKFAQTLELSKKVVSVSNWFASEEGKQQTNEAGIYWNNETIGLKLFGWQKSYYYKVLKVGKLDDAIVENFNNLCDIAQSEGEEPNRTLEGLLKFYRSGGNDTTVDGGNDTAVEEPARAIEIRVPTILTFTYKGGLKNVSVRVDENNQVTTTNDRADILSAIEFLTNLI